jgi:hypothetical protein
MVMVGVLAERHPEHVVLSNGVKIAVAEGLLPEGAEFGRSLTITYTIDGDEKRAEDIQLVPDWLTDWMDEHGHELPDAEPSRAQSPAQESARSTSRVA